MDVGLKKTESVSPIPLVWFHHFMAYPKLIFYRNWNFFLGTVKQI